ncbi:hypothetical protein BJP36_43165 [Moorena producens JHB]|uniref:Uncharacterized protein n=1 Tax=Moorena producens (strain JHB) TaxID=1454205 RepID=A0A9Q9ST53_MOOP1|nr:hypothetical protein [Moorena producens]WAN69162.1 hypothetical protein BJP36_43165 [Moorena producens JHB]
MLTEFRLNRDLKKRSLPQQAIAFCLHIPVLNGVAKKSSYHSATPSLESIGYFY